MFTDERTTTAGQAQRMTLNPTLQGSSAGHRQYRYYSIHPLILPPYIYMNHIIDLINPLPVITFPIPMWPCGRDAHRAGTTEGTENDNEAAGWVECSAPDEDLIQFKALNEVTFTVKAPISIAPFGRDGHSHLTVTPQAFAPDSSELLLLSDVSAAFITRCGAVTRSDKASTPIWSCGLDGHSPLPVTISSIDPGFACMRLLYVSAAFITRCASAAGIPGVRIHMPTYGADVDTNPQDARFSALLAGGGAVDFPASLFTGCGGEYSRVSISVSTGMNAGGMDAGRDAGHGYSIEFSSGTADFTVKDLDLADQSGGVIPAGLFTRCQREMASISASINAGRFQ